MRALPVVAAVAALLLSASAGAQATFRCEVEGKVSYSDVACPGGKVLPAADLRPPATLQADTLAAQQRAQADKKQLRALEDIRQKEERAERKTRQHALNVASARRRKCDALALRKKWLEEDSAGAARHVASKTRRKSQRLAEQYAMECQA